ncbi:MAG: anhydro-N-acetylmuramic acid kinase [bacterium]|nr:anhydro-N-acetylmuramic acid kinase [bacterium]
MTSIYQNHYRVFGLMSGSSLDGVDIACCDFNWDGQNWLYNIIAGKTYPYSDMWVARLQQLPQQSIEIFPKTHAFYGRYLGQLVKQFAEETQLKADFVASHGHTIFHQPNVGFTAQIGDGAAISATCGLPVVCDFRSMDLALGGQGAPLVPIGDALLFAGFEGCLNLGGISNISFKQENKVVAFDISPCNLVFNQLAQALGQPYDNKGHMAQSAMPSDELVQALNLLPYYQQSGARSLGVEWLNQNIWPLLDQFPHLNELEKMASLSKHISFQIAKVINEVKLNRILLTGGGAFNDFLIQQIRQQCQAEIHIPSLELVQFKEALIFAFLGVLRISNQNNVLCSVTGSQRDHVAGALYGNFNSLI